MRSTWVSKWAFIGISEWLEKDLQASMMQWKNQGHEVRV